MATPIGRRGFLGAAAAGAGLAALPVETAEAAKTKRYQKKVSPFPIIMNTSTIRPASLVDKIRVTHEAGYDGIELWIDDIAQYEKDGGNVEDLGKDIRDRGMFVHDVIGLWNCMPPTQEEFDASLVETRERLRLMSAVGSKHAAAIPTPDRVDFDLKWGTHCYKTLMDIGMNDYNVQVAFEFIGFLKGVHRLGQALAVAFDTDDERACLINDTFHLFRGGSGFNCMKLLQGKFTADLHFNDVPGDVPREQMGDEHRVMPGDGILPLEQMLRDMVATGYTGPLSLEIFNRTYWEMDPAEVARIGLDKTLAVVDAAGV